MLHISYVSFKNFCLMKKLLLVAAVMGAAMVFTTACTKTCNCTARTEVEIADPDNYDEDMYEMMKQNNMSSTGTQETKGKCSDLDGTVTQTVWGIREKTITTCK